MDAMNRTNLAIFNSIFHIGANPPLIALIVRPDTAERHTLNNILETNTYTINHLNETIYQQAHQTSARYDKNISEFDAVGLTHEFLHSFNAPFVKESQIKIGVEFRQRINIDLNKTILIIGEIVHVSFPTDCWCADGYLDLEKAKTMAGSGLDSYHTTRRVERLSYAKPDLSLTSVPLHYIQ
jgi:flavin reductase (DIM6/NTAB) family NADH-FMN oxidoreductase RutF